ncbi:MAG: hypothetical protein QM774_09030 [Gordonia sp. (in: high G+C Gram-positive bacteria)]|uniref:hypothetical protein n=1 Tax=Gordonia sp. (in: high G+C Gram-positive bacteria) TaxID=84139 RepID=UPI0039E53617
MSENPELETVASHDDVALLGIPVEIDDIGETLGVEREFLTALVWAPAPLTVGVVHALVGGRDRRDGPEVIAVSAPLFYSPDHSDLFRRVIASVDADDPLTPAALGAIAADPDTSTRYRNLLMEIASPNADSPWPVPSDTDLPALAAAVVDQWHRRGYRALLDRMTTVLIEEPSRTLGGHWDALTVHQRAAETRRSAVVQALLSDLNG